jgi:regulatory protein
MFDVNFQNAKQALENYCAYQERCSFEVLKKLGAFELSDEQKNQIILELKVNNYFSDARYCSAVVSGKFRMNKWGKQKIRAYLKQKRLPDNLISNALKELDPDEYYRTLTLLLEKKWKDAKEKDTFKRQAKVFRYLLSKGFEFELVKEAVDANS